MKYLWADTVEKPKFTSLEKDIETDVLIIGAGMAGILCALQLKEAGVDCVVAEKNTIGSGITGGTTAVISAQHDTLYQDIVKKYDINTAKTYLDLNLLAVQKFRKISENYNCDFENKPSIMYSINNEQLLLKEFNTLKSLGYNAVISNKCELPFSTNSCITFKDMAQFNPLKFLYSAAEKLNIYENTFVLKLEGTTAFTKRGKISAKKVIVATHFPFINKCGLYFAKMYQQRSYVVAYENCKQLDCTAEDIAKNGFYFRNYNDLLLVGGGDHRTGDTGCGYSAINNFVKDIFPDAKEKYAWSNQDCISLDGIPYIGPYSKMMPNVFVISGFNLWGMTSSMVACDIVVNMIKDENNIKYNIFNPSRNIISKQLLLNTANTFVDLVTPTTKRCSHLGCALKWNKIEKSWDCPCHGSRFNQDGKIIDSPAMRDANV